MLFQPTSVAGCFIVELERREDERGFFARYFCEKEFAAQGLETKIVQINNSLSKTAGTLRGLHYQLPPLAETKLLRCVMGALFDVVVDLRPDSPTFRKWAGAELTAENRRMMYVPRGCAHGFLTLVDNTETIYIASAFFGPEQERGLRFDDPAINIAWPIKPVELSVKDRSWPDLDNGYHGLESLRGLL